MNRKISAPIHWRPVDYFRVEKLSLKNTPTNQIMFDVIIQRYRSISELDHLSFLHSAHIAILGTFYTLVGCLWMRNISPARMIQQKKVHNKLITFEKKLIGVEIIAEQCEEDYRRSCVTYCWNIYSIDSTHRVRAQKQTWLLGLYNGIVYVQHVTIYRWQRFI